VAALAEPARLTAFDFLSLKTFKGETWMKLVSTLAAAAAVLSLGAALSTPAFAQKKKAAAEAPAGPKRDFSKGALKALQELQAAATANDTVNFPAKLAAAQAVAKTPDDRYVIGQLQLSMAQAAKDEAGMRTAINAMLSSGATPAEDKPKLYKALGGLAINAKDDAAAIAAYQEALKLTPNDTDILNNMVILYRGQKNYPQAIALLEQRMAAAKAAGQKPDENSYKLALQTALDGKVSAKILPLTREFITAYPTQQNWTTALGLYRQENDADEQTLLDTFRLMRAAKAINSSNEYIAFADTLARGRFYAEARDVVNEGVSAGKYQASNASAAAILREVSGRIAEDRKALAGLEGRARSEAGGSFALKIADGYYGHGDHAKAAEFYRIALQKGGVDAGLVNTRLGMSLAQAGRKAEAEAAFKAVSGKRADLAGFWLLWLGQRA
jgi:tetratricopeptide (TPR) repeat protein